MTRTPPSPSTGQRPAAEHWARYRRLMRWMALVALAAVVTALSLLRVFGGPLPIHFVIATALAIGGSVLLGTALMGLVFLSNDAGYDDGADDRGD